MVVGGRRVDPGNPFPVGGLPCVYLATARRARAGCASLPLVRLERNPSSELAEVLLAIVTRGLSLVVQAGMEAVLGPFDERKLELQKCSHALKQGWGYLSHNKTGMLGKHKREAFEAPSKASGSLGAAWDTWKTVKHRSLKQAAREAHSN